MAYRNLEREVSVSEMLSMKQSGMTNREIAQALGIANSTVSRYIGKRRTSETRTVINDDRDSKPSFGDKCQEYIDSITNAPKTQQTVILADFEIVSSITTLKGKMCSYVVDTVKGTAELTDGLVQGVVDKECIGVLIEELKAIQRRLSA